MAYQGKPRQMECPVCKGKKKLRKQYSQATLVNTRVPVDEEIPCYYCKGTGYIIL